MRYFLVLLVLAPFFASGQGIKISDMPSATSLSGSEFLPIVQTSNKKATVGLVRGWTSIGTANQLLRVNSGATALEFFTPSYLSGIVSIANGGTGLSALGTANQQLRVNGAGTALEYFTPSGGSVAWGDVTGKPNFDSLYWKTSDTTYLTGNTFINGGGFKTEQLSDSVWLYTNYFSLNRDTTGTYGNFNIQQLDGFGSGVRLEYDNRHNSYGLFRFDITDGGTNDADVSLRNDIAGGEGSITIGAGDELILSAGNLANTSISAGNLGGDINLNTINSGAVNFNTGAVDIFYYTDAVSLYNNITTSATFNQTDIKFNLPLTIQDGNSVDEYTFPQIDGTNGQVLTTNGSGVVSWQNPSGGISGSGTTNELTYWTSSSAVGSLSTATYPSLTELSYTKGLTSSAQTQLTAREVLTNKATDLATLNNNLYPTTQSLFQQRSVTGTDASVAADNGKTIVFNSATPFNFTIDALTAGMQMGLINKGTGTVTLVAGSGVTLGGVTSLATNESAAVIYYTSTSVDAIGGGGTALTNPMTTEGDIILAGSGGTPTRLGIGTNGYVLTSNGTTASWQAGGGGGGLTVGTSTITSGTNTRVLYNNSGTLGEYTVSGSGNVAMTTSPTFTTPNLGTPSSATLTNATGLPVSTGISGLGSGVATFLATPSWTNFNSAITGTAPYVGLTGNETIAGTKTFSPTSTVSGLNTGSFAGNPSGLNNGDIWYNSTANALGLRIGGTTAYGIHVLTTDAVANRLAYYAGTSGRISSSASFTVGSTLTAPGFSNKNTSYYEWTGRSRLYSSADGNITLSNAAASGFTSLLFGGTTSSFPALKRSSALLQARLADDSDFADFQASGFLVGGSNRYINFNSTVGSSGYGIRDNSGVVEIKDSGGDWASPGAGIRKKKVSISSAEILNMYTAAKELLAAPGSGKANEVISITIRYNYLTAAYATNTTLNVLYSTVVAASHTGILNQTSSKIKIASSGLNSLLDASAVENQAVSLSVDSGNPTGGSGTLDVYITYRIIDL